jgi:hypothetical protein
MIVEFTKIPNGLNWNSQDRFFTKNILKNGYEIETNDSAILELDNQIVFLCSNDSTIDGKSFTNIQEEINYIYIS